MSQNSRTRRVGGQQQQQQQSAYALLQSHEERLRKVENNTNTSIQSNELQQLYSKLSDLEKRFIVYQNRQDVNTTSIDVTQSSLKNITSRISNLELLYENIEKDSTTKINDKLLLISLCLLLNLH